jgi:ribonuclease HIII
MTEPPNGLTALVFKLKAGTIDEFRRLLSQHGASELVEAKKPNEAFRAKHEATLIIGYRTGKVVANSREIQPIVSKILESLETTDYDITIGSDEAGKGEWLGPLTVAAVALTPKQSAALRSEGVMDSKELSPERITDLRERIVKSCLSQRVLVINPERFNRLFEEIRREGKSLNDLLAWAHATVIRKAHDNASKRYLERAPGKTPSVTVIIDEFDRLKTESRLERALDLQSITVTQRPKAEEETAVAAAGILAKAAREAWIDRRSREVGIDLRTIQPTEVSQLSDAHKLVKASYIESMRRNPSPASRVDSSNPLTKQV